jgi:hypothetical protein
MTNGGIVMTPSQYAARYLPIMVSGGPQPIPVNIGRYHRGAPTDAQQSLWAAAGEHFRKEQKKNPGYRLSMPVSGVAISLASREDVRMSLVRPFYGKGSPEDCQIVLQAALLFGGIRPERLQSWADANLGLDCNGFVGNYLFHDVMKNDWRTDAGDKDPGPSAVITTIFYWAAGGPLEPNALEDVTTAKLGVTYLIARADALGKIIPGGKAGPGHIAITEPGQIMKQSFVSNSMGGLDLSYAKLDMYNHFALRTVESAGPGNGDKGLGMNWMVFQRQTKIKKVFQVRRDLIHMLDTVKITPILGAS